MVHNEIQEATKQSFNQVKKQKSRSPTNDISISLNRDFAHSNIYLLFFTFFSSN